MKRKSYPQKTKYYHFDLTLTAQQYTSLKVALKNYSRDGVLIGVSIHCGHLLSLFNSENADVYEK